MNDPTTRPAAPSARSTEAVGVFYGLAAYGWWGIVAVYFKAIAAVPAFEVLGHRVVWSVLMLGALMAVRGQWRAGLRSIAHRRTLLLLVATTVLIAGNWLVFIHAVQTGQLLQASLGYFINPLVSVLLGFVFLRERLRGRQLVSVALAAGGVAYSVYSLGHLPWIALALALSFGFYGLLRKVVRVDALVGLTAETAMLAPLGVAYLVYLSHNGTGTLGAVSRWMDVLLVCAGPVTALPLLWFTNAARRVRLSTLGFMQYIAPTGQFLLAWLAFGEPLSMNRLISFACIWVALGIYTVDAVRFMSPPRPSIGEPREPVREA